MNSIEYKGFTINIIPDIDPENPRNWDNLGKMVCWNKRYYLGDMHNFSNPDDFHNKISNKNAIILHIYLYDHSGITISTKPFSCNWDSGQIGYIYATYEDIKKEFNIKNITQKIRDKVIGILESEVKTYDQYLTGDVYAYEIFDNSESIDYCCGFYGSNFAMQEAKNICDYHLKEKYPLFSACGILNDFILTE